MCRTLGRILVTLIAFASTADPTSAADAPRIEVDRDDTPLEIQGFVAGTDAEFVGVMRLHGVGTVDSFRVLASDLRSPTDRIGREHVAFIGETSLGDDEYRDVQIKITGVEFPGIYNGQLELLPGGQPRSSATVVPIELTAVGRPVLEPIAPSDAVRGRFAHCGFSCDMTKIVVPGSDAGLSQSLKFDVGKRREAKVIAAQVFGRGASGGRQLTEADLGLVEVAETASSAGVLSIPINIDPNELPADHYTGTIRLSVENLDEPAVIPIDFTVRNAPHWAALAILVGILLGRLANFLQGRGKQLLDEYKRARLLRRRVEREVTGSDREALLRRIADAEAALDDGDLDRAKSLLDEVARSQPGGTPIGDQSQPGPVRALFETLSPVERGLSIGTHLLGVAVWIGLLITGFQTLYVTEGLSFGANGIFDYFGLVLWGLSADVASRTLGNLTGPRPRP